MYRMDGKSRPSALLEVFGWTPIKECVTRAAISRNRTEAFQTGLMVLISSWVTGGLEREAKACGTPAVALKRGSAPEVVCHAVTGFGGKRTGPDGRRHWTG